METVSSNVCFPPLKSRVFFFIAVIDNYYSLLYIYISSNTFGGGWGNKILRTGHEIKIILRIKVVYSTSSLTRRTVMHYFLHLFKRLKILKGIQGPIS